MSDIDITDATADALQDTTPLCGRCVGSGLVYSKQPDRHGRFVQKCPLCQGSGREVTTPDIIRALGDEAVMDDIGRGTYVDSKQDEEGREVKVVGWDEDGHPVLAGEVHVARHVSPDGSEARDEPYVEDVLPGTPEWEESEIALGYKRPIGVPYGTGPAWRGAFLVVGIWDREDDDPEVGRYSQLISLDVGEGELDEAVEALHASPFGFAEVYIVETAEYREEPELMVVVVPDEQIACPGCGAYWGNPDKALDFPNRFKVDDWVRCYNPACSVDLYQPERR